MNWISDGGLFWLVLLTARVVIVLGVVIAAILLRVSRRPTESDIMNEIKRDTAVFNPADSLMVWKPYRWWRRVLCFLAGLPTGRYVAVGEEMGEE